MGAFARFAGRRKRDALSSRCTTTSRARTVSIQPLKQAAPLIELFEIEKALYELRYELRNRPQWAGIPLRALLSRDG